MNPRSAPSSDSSGRFLKEILRFLDLTRDLDRHKDDVEFARDEGNRILYVFDENVFELFVRPWDFRGFTETFHSPFWTNSGEPDELARWNSIAAQSALITAEDLISSGKLPGRASNDFLYLTSWHYSELGHRAKVLRVEMQKTLKTAVKRSKMASYKKDRPTLEPRTGRDRELAAARELPEPPYLRRDLDLLKYVVPPPTSEALERYTTARSAAHALAVDDLFEPIDQLGRIISGELSKRLRDITEAAAVKGCEPDPRQLSSDAETWARRLRKELDQPGRITNDRGEGQISNDAHALALIQHIATQLEGSGTRVVFVTGDNLVFDAYRRWHADLDQTDDVQPFALRRLVQYAPIFHVDEVNSDIKVVDRQLLFERTRQAVEMNTVPLTMSQLKASTTSAGMFGSNREKMTLKLADQREVQNDPELAAFADAMMDAWQKGRARMERIREQWREAERTSIGGRYEVVRARLDRAKAASADPLASAGEESLGSTLASHLQNILDGIVVDSGDFLLPLASRFLDRRLREEITERTKIRVRPTLVVEVEIPGRGRVELGALLTKWIDGEPEGDEILRLYTDPDRGRNSENAFAIAATFALALNDWAKAERFAGLAVTAVATAVRSRQLFAATRGGSWRIRNRARVSGAEFEHRYLQALALRFRIGELGPPSSTFALAAIERLFETASRRLTECAAHYRRPNGDIDNSLLMLRTTSERGALNLFFSAALWMSDCGEMDGDIGDLEQERNRLDLVATDAFKQGVRDLQQCWDLDDDAEEYASSGVGLLNALNKIRRQYVSNTAAAVIFKKVHGKGRDIDTEFFLSPKCVSAVRSLWSDKQAYWPSVVTAEVLAYLDIANPDSTLSGELDQVLQSAKNEAQPLQLDQVMLDAIVEWRGRTR